MTKLAFAFEQAELTLQQNEAKPLTAPFFVEDAMAHFAQDNISLDGIVVNPPSEEELLRMDFAEDAIALDCACQGVETALESLNMLFKLQTVFENYKGVDISTEARQLAVLHVKNSLRCMSGIENTAYAIESFSPDNVSLESIGSLISMILKGIADTISYIFDKFVGMMKWCFGIQTHTEKKIEQNEELIRDIETAQKTGNAEGNGSYQLSMTDSMKFNSISAPAANVGNFIGFYSEFEEALGRINKIFLEFTQSNERFVKHVDVNFDRVTYDSLDTTISDELTQLMIPLSEAMKRNTWSASKDHINDKDVNPPGNISSEIRWIPGFTRDKAFVFCVYTIDSHTAGTSSFKLPFAKVVTVGEPESTLITFNNLNLDSVVKLQNQIKGNASLMKAFTKDFGNRFDKISKNNLKVIQKLKAKTDGNDAIEKIVRAHIYDTLNLSKSLVAVSKAMIQMLSTCNTTQMDYADLVNKLLKSMK